VHQRGVEAREPQAGTVNRRHREEEDHPGQGGHGNHSHESQGAVEEGPVRGDERDADRQVGGLAVAADEPLNEG
jgi:hypothetical protein